MKRFLIIAALASSAMAATQAPSTEELSAALNRASIAWGTKSPWPVEMHMEDLGSCSSLLPSDHTAAFTHVSDNWSRLVITDDDTGETVGVGPIIDSYVTIVSLNSECNWAHMDLDGIMTHEYGHILLGQYHSKDKHSIMYRRVGGVQSITPADRELLSQKMAELK